MLFNGGVMKAARFRERMRRGAARVARAGDVRVLAGADPDLAVAHGAAAYGLARRGRGVRIRGGTARAYYVGIETAMPAVPGLAPPLKALCVAPFGMEEGTEVELPGAELGLVVGEPAEFRLLRLVGATRRRGRHRRRGVAAGRARGARAGRGARSTPTATQAAHRAGAAARARHRGRHARAVVRRARRRRRWKLEFNVRAGGTEAHALAAS